MYFDLDLKLDLDRVKMSQRDKYLGQGHFVQHRHTHETVCSTWTTEVVDNVTQWLDVVGACAVGDAATLGVF